MTPGTVARQAPPSMEFSRHEYWSGLPFPSSGALPDPGIEPIFPVPPAFQADSLPLNHLGSPIKVNFEFSGVFLFVCFCFLFCFVFSIFKRLCEHLHHLVPQHFHDPKKNPQNSHWTFTPHPHPAPGNLWSASSSISITLVQFSCSVMSDSLWPHVTKALQASLSITNSQSLLKLMFEININLCLR